MLVFTATRSVKSWEEKGKDGAFGRLDGLVDLTVLKMGSIWDSPGQNEPESSTPKRFFGATLNVH